MFLNLCFERIKMKRFKKKIRNQLFLSDFNFTPVILYKRRACKLAHIADYFKRKPSVFQIKKPRFSAGLYLITTS